MSQWRDLNSWPLPYQGSALPLSYTGTQLSGRRGSNSRHSAWKADALPTELLPLIICSFLWGEQDSNLRRYEPTDLQSVLVGRLSISPTISSRWRDSNPRPADYKSAALANWATSAIIGNHEIKNIPVKFRIANVQSFFLLKKFFVIFLSFIHFPMSLRSVLYLYPHHYEDNSCLCYLRFSHWQSDITPLWAHASDGF